WCQQTLRQACSQEYPGSARCVQSFDDSLDSASRKTYRISLRSSSLWEPRHPSLKVLQPFTPGEAPLAQLRITNSFSGYTNAPNLKEGASVRQFIERGGLNEPAFGNDPSAGSPTETLLRLHLPLNVEV
ncbi:unnamed protein product, partial [Laminaria digitata]